MPLTPVAGMDFLGSLKLSGNAVTTGVLTIPARDVLFLLVNIAGYSSGGDIASLRFNGDTGANYWDRHLTSAAGGVVWTNTQTLSTTLIRLAGNVVNVHRTVAVSITNIASLSKPLVMQTQTASTLAATGGLTDLGSGEWVNTSAQITSIEMRTAGGSITMPSGTGFGVWGKNL